MDYKIINQIPITITKTGNRYEVPEYDIKIKAKNDDEAIKNITTLLKRHKDFKDKNVYFLYSVIHIQDDKKIFNEIYGESKSIRRSITLPKWMNDEINEKNINASKLLQDAYIEKYHKEKDYLEIENVNELICNVDEDILKEYVKQYLHENIQRMID